jgi:hypothetical protein
MAPSRECTVCLTDTGELYNINSRYVCLPCIASDGWFISMAAERQMEEAGFPVDEARVSAPALSRSHLA